MKGKIWRRIFCVSMAMLLLVTAGCSKIGTNGASGNQSEEGTENQKDNEINNVVENNAESDKNESSASEEKKGEVYGGGEYSDVIFDRKVIDGEFAIYFLRTDVSYTSNSWSSTDKGGDSAILIAPDGTTMLYDCSTVGAASYITYALKELGIEKIDYFVLSHPHLDHIGAFSTVARNFEIGHVYMPPSVEVYDNVTAQGGYVAAFMRTLILYDIPYTYVSEGDSFEFSKDIQVKVYNPPADMDFAEYNYNEWSLVLKFVYKDSSLMLAGDIGNNAVKNKQATESLLISKYGSELQADVAKMNHHGDGNVGGNTKAGSREWLNTVKAKIYVGMRAIVTDEKGWFTYVSTGAECFHSALDGTVLVYTGGDGEYDVQYEEERATDYYGTHDAKNGHMTVK